MEQPSEQSSRRESLLQTLREHPEDFNDLEASMLFLDVGYREFEEVLMRQYKKRSTDFKPFDLMFSLNDPDFGVTDADRVMRLRQLKALRENDDLSCLIGSITVKGREDQRMLEANVFSSNVTFIAEE